MWRPPNGIGRMTRVSILTAMTYPHAPGGDEYRPPPPDQIQPYQPPQPYGEAPGYGPPQGYPYDYNYGAPYTYPGYQIARPTDGFAIASLVVSCVSVLGLCMWGVGALLGVLGAIFGHVSRRRIRASGAGGARMALAGIIVGWSMAAIGLILLTVVIVMIAVDSGATSDF
jgi:hypothetical protein